MKNLSRLTALLLALMMLFTSMPAFATESEAIPVDEFEAADYASLLAIAEEDAAATADASWDNIFDGMPCAKDNVYCQNVLHMLECPNAQKRYEYLNTLYSEEGVELEFTMLHYYYYHVEDQESMSDSVVCTCSFPFEEPEYVIPAPGDISKHDESCPWHFANLSLAEQYDVIRNMDADTQATYKETLSADALETLNRVNVSEYATGNVAISVPEGAFDDDYLLEVEPVTLTEEQLGLLFNAEASGFLSAFDITFAKLGEETTELQPAVGNPVNLDFSGLNDGLHVVYHLYETDNGYEVEIVNLDNTVGGTIEASAEAFSIYIVTSTSDTSTSGTSVADGGTYPMTVGETKIFYWPRNNSSNRYTWDVYDVDGVISYEIAKNSAGAGAGGDTQDWTYQAPWITITALKSGTNATLTIKSEDGTVETFYIAVSEKTVFHIENQVAKNGCLVPVGATSTEGTIEYTWTRSDKTIVRADALNTDGSVNVSTDRGGVTNSRTPITYTVIATVTKDDGTVEELGEASYEVIYGQEILNPSFEYPEVERSANQYFFNGYPGLYWKTTAPGTGQHVTADVELSEKMSTYGYDNDTDYEAADGDQFAELNAENFGALYQDILTTPGATLTWGFAHAKRDDSKAVNDMYVVMGATKDAQDILTKDQIDGLLDAIPNGVTPPSSGTGYKLTYNNEVYYIWYHDAGDNQDTWENISGSYTVPAGQYLTRLFFASNTNGANSGSTLGNLIDATSAHETLTYRIEYYVNNSEVPSDLTEGEAKVYSYVKQEDQLAYYLSKYTLTGVTVNGQSYPDDITAGDFKGFYVAPYRAQSGENDCLVVFRLYFKENAVTVSKQVTVDNWAELSSTKQYALMNGYVATFGLYKSTDLENPVSTVTVPVTYVEGQDLIALGDFPLNGLLDEGTTYVVKEISATELSGYALTTTYGNGSSTYPNFVVTTNGYTENVTCLNAYTFKKGALTITKNVTDGAFPANGKAFTFTVTPAEGQDLSNWLEDNDYTASGDGFEVDVNVDASKTASVTLAGLPAGKYNVVETAYERYNTTYQVGSAAATTTPAVANVTQNGEANVIVTNTAKTGELTITKVVKDSTFTEGSKTFNFTVDGPVTKTGSITVNAANKATASANTAVITDLPVGTYTVTETNAAELGYAPTYDKTQVTIEAGGKETVNVVNTASEKIDINVTKVWEDYNNLTNTRPVEITVNLVASYSAASDSTLVSAPSGSTAADPWTHTFENVEKFDPNGNLITYRVTENEITGELYNDPVITGNATDGFRIVNTLKPGSLEITKTVVDEVTTDGATPDSAQAFTFAVTLKHNGSDLTGVTYSVDGGEAQTFNGTITLTNGQKATFANLPAGTVYTVTETNIPVGFEVDQDEKIGNVAANAVSTAAFTNTFKVGNLTITKKLKDQNGNEIAVDDPNTSKDPFTFVVTLPDGTYTVSGKKYDGTAYTKTETIGEEQDRIVIFVYGQDSVVIGNIPIGVEYTVEEVDPQDGYTFPEEYAVEVEKEVENDEGIMETVKETKYLTTGAMVENGKTVTFTNTYTTGSLKISKTVVGEDAPKDDQADTFNFTVYIPGGTYSYKLNGIEQAPFVVESGSGSLQLKHGDVAEISGIPNSASYSVYETESADYTTTKTGDVGMIDATTVKEAKFTNTYNYSHLTVVKEGMTEGNAIVVVTIDEKPYTLVLNAGNSWTQTIAKMPIDAEYSVKEMGDWTWRYTTSYPDGNASGSIEEGGVTVRVLNTPDTNQWLDDETSIKNVFDGTNPNS